jgi:hypothetical protein
MEPLWSPAVAIGGSQWQMARPRRPLEQAKTVAVGCDRLPETFHGKEGVDGSSPSEGSAKASHAAPRPRLGVSHLTTEPSRRCQTRRGQSAQTAWLSQTWPVFSETRVCPLLPQSGTFLPRASSV